MQGDPGPHGGVAVNLATSDIDNLFSDASMCRQKGVGLASCKGNHSHTQGHLPDVQKTVPRKSWVWKKQLSICFLKVIDWPDL